MNEVTSCISISLYMLLKKHPQSSRQPEKSSAEVHFSCNHGAAKVTFPDHKLVKQLLTAGARATARKGIKGACRVQYPGLTENR